jgi:hypothetical protein
MGLPSSTLQELPLNSNTFRIFENGFLTPSTASCLTRWCLRFKRVEWPLVLGRRSRWRSDRCCSVRSTRITSGTLSIMDNDIGCWNTQKFCHSVLCCVCGSIRIQNSSGLPICALNSHLPFSFLTWHNSGLIAPHRLIPVILELLPWETMHILTQVSAFSIDKISPT